MKYWMMFLVICCLFLLSMDVQAQCRMDPPVQCNGYSLTGNLQYDLSTYANVDSVTEPSVKKRKVVYRKTYSPLMAGLFSAAVPGAGQFYTKSYWQSAAFFGAEVLMWVAYAAYENSGDSKTAEFQKYADAHWSVVRYAHWIEETPGLPANYNRSLVIPSEPTAPGRLDDFISEPWNYVSWEQLNICEDNIARNATSTTGFTHRLESHGEQQYYEMIGKYAQFGGGWDDAWDYSGSSPIPLFKQNDVLTQNVSQRFLAYSKMRGDANSLYTIATTMSYIIVANHVFGALEAAWNAARINNRIKLQGHIESRRVGGNMVEFVPTLHFECEL